MKRAFLLLTVLFSAVVLTGCGAKKQPQANVPPTSEPEALPTKPIEEGIKENPYLSLEPTTDGHWVNYVLKNIPSNVTGIDYDLIYFTEVEGSKIERGISTAGVPAELTGNREYSKKVLFGSASCTTGTCKYKYDENVTEGSLSLKLITASGKVPFNVAYRIQKGNEAKTAGLTAGDGAFTLTSQVLTAKSLYLTTSTIGIPVQLPSGVTAKGAPYGIFPSISGKATVSFKTDLTGVSIYAYDGKAWAKLSTTINNGVATATATNASLFILGI